MKSELILESFLQKQRFSRILPYITGEVLDFGGNKGELAKYIDNKYFCVNYDYTILKGRTFDTIVSLAVLEHIPLDNVNNVIKMFYEHLNKGGKVIITTPTPLCKPILEFLANLRILDKENIMEHKKYYRYIDLYKLFKKNNFNIKLYKKFQFGLNQLAIFEK